MKHGVGILKLKHQEYYKGEFMWDQYDGKGTYVFNNGDKVHYYLMLLTVSMKVSGKTA